MVKSKISQISLDGGLLCLDFINSVPTRKDNIQPGYLSDIFDLIIWAKRLEVIDTKTENLLSGVARKHPKEANSFFRKAIDFRELLYKLFWPVSAFKGISHATLENYNKLLKIYFPSLQIIQSANGFGEGWLLEDASFKRLVAPILNDSYELLLSDKLVRLKECPNCGWLFYDSTKNGNRRWCSMKSCGNNIKALEWYHKHKK